MKITDHAIEMNAESRLEQYKDIKVLSQVQQEAVRFRDVLAKRMDEHQQPIPVNRSGGGELQALKQNFIQAFLDMILGESYTTSSHSMTGNSQQPMPLVREKTTVEIQSTLTRSQSMTFRAEGVIETADGRKIALDLNYTMSESSTLSNSMRLETQRLLDPIVMQYDGPMSELEALGDRLDLDLDGMIDSIPFPKSGSGYLVLDKNGNGIIDDGKEMFGPSSGHGFDELAEYDSDGNRWIDENDAIFTELQIWHQDLTGNKQLSSLTDLEIGAIYLGHQAAGYSHYDEAGNLLGQIKRAGILLKEDGTPKPVHEIDVNLKL